jgi:uncharacterized repeat protein (TIGR01451 family)
VSSTVKAGENIVFHVVVENQGDIQMTDTIMTDILPSGVSAISVDNSACAIKDPQTVVCDMGVVQPYNSKDVYISAVASADGTYTNIAGLSYTRFGRPGTPLKATSIVNVKVCGSTATIT